MKKLWIICFMTLVGLHLAAQDIVYSTLKDLLAHKGDTVAALKIEKRTKNQISLSGGADYKISADDSFVGTDFLYSFDLFTALRVSP